MDYFVRMPIRDRKTGKLPHIMAIAINKLLLIVSRSFALVKHQPLQWLFLTAKMSKIVSIKICEQCKMTSNLEGPGGLKGKSQIPVHEYV